MPINVHGQGLGNWEKRLSILNVPKLAQKDVYGQKCTFMVNSLLLNFFLVFFFLIFHQKKKEKTSKQVQNFLRIIHNQSLGVNEAYRRICLWLHQQLKGENLLEKWKYFERTVNFGDFTITNQFLSAIHSSQASFEWNFRNNAKIVKIDFRRILFFYTLSFIWNDLKII